MLQLLWKYSGEIQPLKLLGRDTKSIGQNLSTKAIGRMEREVSRHRLELSLHSKIPNKGNVAIKVQ